MMRNLKIKLPVILCLLLILTAVSCTPESCFEETNAFLKATFYLRSTNKLMAPDSLTIYGLNMESKKLYDKQAGVQPALIPLNPSAENCSFIIMINGTTDTLTFGYNSYPHLLSKECGYTFYHELKSRFNTNNIIDTVVIATQKITTDNAENLRIYY